MSSSLPPIRWRHATTFLARLRGLLFYAPLVPGEALRISPCNAVHTIGMRYAIDVVFVAADGSILKVVPGLPPWRMASCRHAVEVIELAAGQASVNGLHTGASCPAASLQAGADDNT
jgi:uncharacterized membrane protein (UPF0127 family)